MIKKIERLKLGDSPARNFEAEEIMYEIISRSAEKGVWVDIPVSELNPAKNLYARTDTRAGESPLTEGLINLRINGLVTIENVGDVKIVRVTKKFIDFYERRIS